jgi:hypothetical protein
MAEKIYNNCQSCDMPLKADPGGGGTDVEGLKSKMYCSYCFQKGFFTWPDRTLEEMQTFCKKKLRDMGYSKLSAWFMTRRIPYLERWKK